ncbi:MAG TPA: DUF4440 domain-containing protein [Longimicrobiaceae bacterium]|nr:DUF4440 domain-containing protein [Longimicrobiaceae bacterium]
MLRVIRLSLALASCALLLPLTAVEAQDPVAVSPNLDRALLTGRDTAAMHAFRSLLMDRRRWATTNPDVAPLGPYFAEDAILMGRYGELHRGRAAILGWWRRMVSFGEVTFDRRAIGASGRIIYLMGRYRHLIRKPDGRGRLMVDLGSYTTVWERQADGAWRIQSMLVASEPNPGSPATPGGAAGPEAEGAPGQTAAPARSNVRDAPETAGRTPAPASLPGRVFAPGGRPFFAGVFLGDAESRTEVIDRSIRDFTAMTGKRPALVKTFHAFSADFSPSGWAGRQLRLVQQAGATNFVALAPAWTSNVPTDSLLRAVTSGNADDELTRIARHLRDLGAVVLVEPGWEMNGRWGYRWQGVDNGLAANAPQRYVAAWRRMVDIFRREGAQNVRWVWSPNTGNPVTGGAPGPAHWNWYGHYYPGNEYVDYLGLHGFNGPSVWHQKWQTFEEIFSGTPGDHTLPDMVRRFPDKPIILSELASEPDPAHLRRGGWVRSAYRQMIEHPRVVGAVWFHARKEADWRLNAYAEILQAYREVMLDPRVLDRFSDVAREGGTGDGRP